MGKWTILTLDKEISNQYNTLNNTWGAGRVLAKVAKFGFTLDKHIFLKVARALCIVSQFAYMSTRTLITTTIDEIPFSNTLWWIPIPFSRSSMVAHARRKLAKVTKSRFTSDICIWLKVFRAFSENQFVHFIWSLHSMRLHFDEAFYQIIYRLFQHTYFVMTKKSNLFRCCAWWFLERH